MRFVGPKAVVVCCGVILLLATVPVRVKSLAAKKNKGQRPRRASSNKGFGAKPLTFDEVVGTFKTRLPPNANGQPCPCGVLEAATYGNCCGPYHDASKVAESPLRVLQTRYSAFCYRLVPYIMETTHSTCRDYQSDRIAWAKELNKNGMFDSFEFVALEPGTTSYSEGKEEEEAFLDFTVRLKSIVDGEETVVSEKSRFLKDEGNRWLYASGDVRSQEAGLEDIKLNP